MSDSSSDNSNQPHPSGASGAVLVTGGSGLIGRRLVHKLAEGQQTVVCMYHHRLPDPMANVYPVCSDMGSAELIAAPLRGVETVVHLAWEGSLLGPTEKVSWNLNSNHLPRNVKLLRNLIQAMEKAGTKRIVFLSAIGASRKTKVPFLQEKYLAEFFILNSKIPEKVIVRSSVVYGGDNDRFVNSIKKVMQFPGIYPVPRSAELLAPIHLDDITGSLMSIALKPRVEGGVGLLELNGGEALPIDELFRLVSERYHSGSKIPIRGFIGNSLLPLFERDSKNETRTTKLRHFLTIGNKVDSLLEVHNPIVEEIPRHSHSFKDSFKRSKEDKPSLGEP